MRIPKRNTPEHAAKMERKRLSRSNHPEAGRFAALTGGMSIREAHRRYGTKGPAFYAKQKETAHD